MKGTKDSSYSAMLYDSVDRIGDALRQIVRGEVRDAVREELASIVGDVQQATSPRTDRMLSTAEAATFAGVRRETVRRWFQNGELRGHRAGREWRVRGEDLMHYLARAPRGEGIVDINDRANEILRQVSAAAHLSDDSARIK